MLEIESQSSARAAARELRGQFALRRLRLRAFFEEGLDPFAWDRRKMKLQATRTDRREKRIRPRREQDERCAFGRLLEDFKKDVRIGPAHRIGAIKDENAPPTLGLEIRCSPYGAE